MKGIITGIVVLLIISTVGVAQSQTISYNIASIFVNGDVNATNVVADFFIGDGSNLTALRGPTVLNETFLNETIDARTNIKEAVILITNDGFNTTNVLSNDILQLIVTPNNLSTSFRFEGYENNTGLIIDANRREHTGVWDVRHKATTVDNAVVLNVSNISQNDVFTVQVRYR